MTELEWGSDGLVAAVVQDADTAQVLMLGWMNHQALAATLETGRVHFWSRSRQELWEKGATSGNFLDLVSLEPDCDRDALLVTARPQGPVCHTGSVSCWDADSRAGFAALDGLWEVVTQRTRTRPEGSYTASLVAGGPEATGRKLVEEATEVLLAAKDHAAGVAGGVADGVAAERRVAEEAADLVYHLLVTLAERGVAPARVMEVLAERRR